MEASVVLGCRSDELGIVRVNALRTSTVVCHSVKENSLSELVVRMAIVWQSCVERRGREYRQNGCQIQVDLISDCAKP